MNNFAKYITKRVGTIGFFFIIFTWTILWLGWNIFAPIKYCFDPYPAFVAWLFISNMIQIFLMPLIMIGQNIQSAHMESILEKDFKLDRDSKKILFEILIILKNNKISEN